MCCLSFVNLKCQFVYLNVTSYPYNKSWDNWNLTVFLQRVWCPGRVFAEKTETFWWFHCWLLERVRHPLHFGRSVPVLHFCCLFCCCLSFLSWGQEGQREGWQPRRTKVNQSSYLVVVDWALLSCSGRLRSSQTLKSSYFWRCPILTISNIVCHIYIMHEIWFIYRKNNLYNNAAYNFAFMYFQYIFYCPQAFSYVLKLLMWPRSWPMQEAVLSATVIPVAPPGLLACLRKLPAVPCLRSTRVYNQALTVSHCSGHGITQRWPVPWFASSSSPCFKNNFLAK